MNIITQTQLHNLTAQCEIGHQIDLYKYILLEENAADE